MQFTLKVKVVDSANEAIATASVKFELQGTATENTKETDEDGFVTFNNNDNKFQFGSTLSITVTESGYLAQKFDYVFGDSDMEEQEKTVILLAEGLLMIIIFVLVNSF